MYFTGKGVFPFSIANNTYITLCWAGLKDSAPGYLFDYDMKMTRALHLPRTLGRRATDNGELSLAYPGMLVKLRGH